VGSDHDHAGPPLAEFASDRCWVTWQPDPTGRKRPVQRVTAGAVAPANTAAPGTWRTREAAERLAAELRALGQEAGIGLVAHLRRSGDQVVLVDLDAAIDPVTATVKEWAETILDKLRTYAEVSPSGTGLHIVFRIAAADTPAVEALLRQGRKIRAGRKWFRKAPKGEKAEGIEFIWRGYATFTGDRLLDQPRDVRVVPIEAVEWLCKFAEAFKAWDRDAPPDGTQHAVEDQVGGSEATSTAAGTPTIALAELPVSILATALEAGTHASAIAAKHQPGRRMEWDAAYVSGLAARLDDVEFSLAAAYATVGRATRDGRAEAGVSVERLEQLTGRQHGSRSSSQAISGGKARLVRALAMFSEAEPAMPPAFGRAGSVTRFTFKAWWSPSQDKNRTSRVIVALDLWEELLRGGAIRRRSLRIIARILSDLVIEGHDRSAIFVPKTCALARVLGVKPSDVVGALDDATNVGLCDTIEPRRPGRGASYVLSPRGAARWPPP
jgi:hypothetical protein